MPPEYHARSLADAQPGDTVEILHILFEEHRDYCTRLGLTCGTRAALREHNPAGILLDLPPDRSVWVDNQIARFIEVRVADKADKEWLLPTGVQEPTVQIPAV